MIRNKRFFICLAFILAALILSVFYAACRKSYKTAFMEGHDVNLIDADRIETDKELSMKASGKMVPPAAYDRVVLGDDQITSAYSNLIKGKRVGIITNQTGVNSKGKSIIDVLANYQECKLTALYAPEHGLDGKTPAGEYVYSYMHPVYNIPVYSLYGDTRKPTTDMLSNIDVLLFDIQDIGARTYTYISTLNYCMKAASENGKAIVVLDRPNPLGGLTVEGYILEDKFTSFVGIDSLPYVHGMTVGELAKFFNRKIGANVQIVPMQNYERSMVFQDTGLEWIQTSPMIPTIDAAFNYSATGSNEGITRLHEKNFFNWVGGAGIDGQKYAALLNSAGLQGVKFEAAAIGSEGGVNVVITDYKKYNPARVSIYLLVYAHDLTGYEVPKGNGKPVMFEKIQGTDKIGRYIEEGLRPEEIIGKYTSALEAFKLERAKYLIYD